MSREIRPFKLSEHDRKYQEILDHMQKLRDMILEMCSIPQRLIERNEYHGDEEYARQCVKGSLDPKVNPQLRKESLQIAELTRERDKWKGLYDSIPRPWTQDQQDQLDARLAKERDERDK